MGKTRLAEELLVYARLRGCFAATGHCYEQEVNVPYLPFSAALRTIVRSIPDDRLPPLVGSSAPELIKLFPELALRIPGLTPSPPLEPEQERLRLFEGVTASLAGYSRTQPLLLMLDDLHWADAATLALLRHVARGVRAERVLILGTYRDVEVDPDHPLSASLSEMNRERLYKRVLLRGLSPDHVATMIRAIFQYAQPVSEEFRDLIYRETEGNPFFVEEVLKHLVETGALYIEAGRWERKPIQEIDVPQSMREVIGRRLKRVSEPCQRVLSLGAVIGRRFRFEVLQAVSDLPEDQLLDALEEAIQAQVIREESEAGEVEYDFVHALIREVLYDRLSLRRRMTLHQKVGETLERQHAGRLDTVAE
ncbi:MAG: ATP-binding protein, partial [bacterium]